MRAWVVLVLLLAAPESMAREVSVSLFELFKPHQVKIESLGTPLLAITAVAADGRRRGFEADSLAVRCDGQTLVCARLAGKKFCSTRIEVRGSGFAADRSGGLRLGVANGPARRYDGWLEVRPARIAANVCLVVNHVGIEDYVQSVACHEMRPGGSAALRAQAIASRSYALSMIGKHADRGFDFCDLTHCQVYTGHDACTSEQRHLLKKVAGLVLLYNGSPARAYYFSTCAGSTASAADVWGSDAARPYLTGVSDGKPPFCSNSPHMHWTFRIGRASLCSRLSKQFPALGGAGQAEDCKLSVDRTSRGGWVGQLSVSAGDRTIKLRGERFHMLMGKWYGWGKFKSARFNLEKRGQQLVFHGRGMGHGIGMCQYGAMGMQQAGADFSKILGHYYPGTRIGRLP